MSVLVTSAYFVVFVLYFNYDPPLPFSAIAGYLCYYVCWIPLWFSIPKAKRNRHEVRKQYKIYLLYDFLNIFIWKIIFDVYTMAFKSCPADIQWIIGIGLPILRDACSWVKIKLLNLTFEERNTKLVELIALNVGHAFFVSVNFGPNSSILGNYGNEYWTFRQIESLNKYVYTTIEMFLFDCFSCIFGGLILWKYCSINLFREIGKQINEYWILIAMATSRSLNLV